MLFDVCAEDLQNVIGGSLFFKWTTTLIGQRSSVMSGWSAVTAGSDTDDSELARSARWARVFATQRSSLRS